MDDLGTDLTELASLALHPLRSEDAATAIDLRDRRRGRRKTRKARSFVVISHDAE